ncbi:hypothetical protein FOA52_000139 [Chlamydomonas sp. UWO 241]|nr:hypothetical protein FOA52_000139 [Chlamydomonas sp. UWO 241]
METMQVVGYQDARPEANSVDRVGASRPPSAALRLPAFLSGGGSQPVTHGSSSMLPVSALALGAPPPHAHAHAKHGLPVRLVAAVAQAQEAVPPAVATAAPAAAGGGAPVVPTRRKPRKPVRTPPNSVDANPVDAVPSVHPHPGTAAASGRQSFQVPIQYQVSGQPEVPGLPAAGEAPLRPAATPVPPKQASQRLKLLGMEILRFQVRGEAMAEREMREKLGNNPDTSKALRKLLQSGEMRRTGLGGRGDPFKYVVTDAGWLVVESLRAGRGMAVYVLVREE